MNISKLGALWKLMTGGWAGLAVYILESVNKWLATLDQSKLAQAAQIVKAVASAQEILLGTFLPLKYRAAATKTLEALNTLALALAAYLVERDNITVKAFYRLCECRIIDFFLLPVLTVQNVVGRYFYFPYFHH